MVIFIIRADNVHAEDYQRFSPWQSAYLQILQDARESHDHKVPDEEKLMAYMLYDIDKDNILGLILSFGMSTEAPACQIYSTSENNAVCIDQYFYSASSYVFLS